MKFDPKFLAQREPMTVAPLRHAASRYAMRILVVLVTLIGVCGISLQACAQESKTQTPANAVVQDTTPTRTPDVIFVPTPMEVVNEMFSVAKVGKNDTLYDLGSGDGRIVIAATKRFGTKAIGIDIDPQRIKESLRNADTAGVANQVEFRQADLFKTDLRNATVVTLYLLPRLNVQLRPKLYNELRPGTRITSHAFDMGDWKPDSTMSVGGRSVYYWVIPANVSGTWTMTSSNDGANRNYTLKLTQRYQQVTGTATANGKEVTLSNLRVMGDSIRFTLMDGSAIDFQGTVSGSTMRGTVPNEWSATRANDTMTKIAD